MKSLSSEELNQHMKNLEEYDVIPECVKEYLLEAGELDSSTRNQFLVFLDMNYSIGEVGMEKCRDLSEILVTEYCRKLQEGREKT